MARLPLEGIRIIDLTVVWAGPGVTMHLGDLGAEVIRVESLFHFAPSTRGMLPHITKEQAAAVGYLAALYPDKDPGERPYNRAALFNCNGRNKLSVTMPLDRPEGREAFLELAKISDVFIENNAVRLLDRLDLTWDVLHEINPRLIVVRMPALGLSGPFKDYLGFGTNFNALSGIVAMDGYHDSDPTSGTDNLMMDEISPTSGALTVLAALYARERDGQGRYVEYAQAEGVAQTVGEYILDNQMNSRVPPLVGNRHAVIFQGVYPCAGDDRWIAVSVRDDRDWAALKWVMGHPDWAEDHRFNDPVGRLAAHDEIDRGIAAYTSQHDLYVTFTRLQDASIPAGPVLPPSLVHEDPQVLDRGWYIPLTHPETGTHDYPGFAWRASKLELAAGRAAPRVGEDNEHVYRDILGYSEERYRALVDAGLVGTELRLGG